VAERPPVILEVTKLAMDFGGLRAINQVSLAVREGEITTLIGPNGAGKTTFFNCLTGLYRPTGGEIAIVRSGGGRERIDGLRPNVITSKGLARTFQNIRLFQNMTVLENVMIGRHCRTKAGILGAVLRTPGQRREERGIMEKSYDLLEKVGLGPQADEVAKNLPYGMQRRLEIARALATDPFLLLLDEPAAGMNAIETRELEELLRRLRGEGGVTIFLIEHDMKLVMSISSVIAVMDYGEKIAEGTPEEVRNDPAVITAYLGEEQDA
jgi:branched-chain amino acid transport system ATP-binding protein